eukprot:TRINITY_DN74696_c0_g1_i1.p1 TRINITY_DN74696_c0_g1~~TRINITY_DN74696_c0_g1_i1.p1  ORF type:complete len:359 (-),score=35.42 TRINITY_DN74696_c0_g1_i1:160-1236(-)
MALSSKALALLGPDPAAEISCGRAALKPTALESISGSVVDRAIGLMLGVAVGDAAGGCVEFELNPRTEMVNAAMQMGGGGPHRLAGGQVTDDTESAIAVAEGLLQGREHASSASELPCDAVARQMHKWSLSSPFDIGKTTGRACARGCEGSSAMRAAASEESCSNGSLMRCSSLGVVATKLGDDAQLFAAASAHATLTHQVVHVAEAEACYLKAARHLLLHNGDVEGALAETETFCAAFCGEVVRTWLSESLDKDSPLPACGPHGMGSVEHGFRRSFWHLRRGSPFSEAIREVIAEGYDADTNAAIVGGMLGARDGICKMPADLWKPVVSCDTRKGRPRPLVYHPARIPVLAEKLLAM